VFDGDRRWSPRKPLSFIRVSSHPRAGTPAHQDVGKECGAAAAVAVGERGLVQAVVNQLVGEVLTTGLTLTNVMLCHLVFSNSERAAESLCCNRTALRLARGRMDSNSIHQTAADWGLARRRSRFDPETNVSRRSIGDRCHGHSYFESWASEHYA